MSTVMKNSGGPMLPLPSRRPTDQKQLQHDRWHAVAIVALVVAIIALTIWMASLGGGVVYEAMEHWPILP